MRILYRALIGATLLLAPVKVAADPFSVDDMLRLEDIGQVVLSPSGRVAGFERLGPIDDIPSHEYDYLDRVQRAELFIAPTMGGEPPRRLLAQGEGRGHGFGPWAPGDDHVVVYRLRDRQLDLGIADVQDGSVRWVDGTAELASWGRAATWRSDRELIALMRADGDLPAVAALSWQAQARLPRLWAKTREGNQAGRTLIGGGRFAHLTPQSSPGKAVAVDAATGQARTLALGRFYDMELSPTGRFLALAAFADEQGFDPAKAFLGGDLTQRRSLTILDMETGEVWSPAPDDSLSPHLLSWSPTGDELLVYVRGAREAPTEGRLLRLRPSDRTSALVPLFGFVPAVTESGLRTPVVSADWLDGEPVLYARKAQGRADWTVLQAGGAKVLSGNLEAPSARLAAITKGALVIADGQQLTAVYGDGRPDLVLGEAVQLTRAPVTGFFGQGQRFDFTGAPRRDWVVARRDGRRMRISIDTGAAFGEELPVEPMIRAVDREGAVVGERQGLVQTLSRADAVPLVEINGAYRDRQFAAPREIHHRGADGRMCTSWLYLPPDEMDPPLIIVAYPGAPERPQRPWDENTMANAFLMNARGYAVLVPDLSDVGRPGEPAEGIAEAILKIVDVAEVSGGFNADRLILWGHSFGAYGVMNAAGQSDRFVAVVAANGAYDLIGAWGSFPLARSVAPEWGLSVRSHAGSVEQGQSGLGGPPWSRPDTYLRNSPLMSADKITAPVLLIAADRDYIPDSQAEEMFSALYRQNKDAALLTYRGEGHILFSPGNIRDYWSTIWAWLDEALSPAPSRARVSKLEPSSP